MNHKQSKQRTRLLEMLRNHPGHLSAEQAYLKLKEDEQGISLATVYRNLNLLSAQRIINKIDDPSNGAMYDGREYPHYHFRCDVCNQLFDIPGIYLDIDTSVETLMHAKVNHHRIVFEGTCETCLQNKMSDTGVKKRASS